VAKVSVNPIPTFQFEIGARHWPVTLDVQYKNNPPIAPASAINQSKPINPTIINSVKMLIVGTFDGLAAEKSPDQCQDRKGEEVIVLIVPTR
jgi:hypothetical protein